MPKYTLTITIANSFKDVPYELNLEGPDQDYPEDYFRRHKQIQYDLQQKLQREHSLNISPQKVEDILKKWAKKIKIGRGRNATHILDVPLDEIPKKNSRTQSTNSSNQTQANSTNYPKPKNPKVNNKHNSQKKQNSSQSNPEVNKPEEPRISEESGTTEADF